MLRKKVIFVLFALFYGNILCLSISKFKGGREICPLEMDFPENVELKGRTVQCSPTPEDHECEWLEDPHFACHDARVGSDLLTFSTDYALDTAFYDLCLDMIAVIGEPYGASATARVTYNRTGTLRYTPDGEWESQTTNHSYHRLACQTSPAYLYKNEETAETNLIEN